MLIFAFALATNDCADGNTRTVRFWLGGTSLVKDGACNDGLIANISKYERSLDSLGLELGVLRSNGSEVWFDFGDLEETAFGCLAQIRQQVPRLKLGVCIAADSDPGSLTTVAKSPPSLAAAVRRLLAARR